jgi:methyl-accepting chemotaxis protein
MVKTSADSKAGSLKGKIRLATTGLALMIAVCGLAAYYINLLAGNSFYAVFAPFLLLALTAIFFGGWLANEIVAPVEKVALLAKSMERGVSTSLPKTSGAIETDELLQSIFRLNYQIQTLVASMDEVADGNLEITLSHKNASDRVIQTFQKLLAKVSESIHARQDLEKLQFALANLSEEVSPVKHGNLFAEIETDAEDTKEIAAVLHYLIEQLGDLVSQTKNNSRQIRQLNVEAQKTIREVIRKDETRVQKMTQASVVLKQVPHAAQKILAELSQSSANPAIEKARHGTQTARKNLSAVSNLRLQIREAVKFVQSLNERSQEIGKIARTVEDLAQRTKMVALNASVQANELGEKGRGFVVVSEEVERLARRADNMNKQISTLNKSMMAEIGEAENALKATAQEAANLSKFAIETDNVLGELEKCVAGFSNLQSKIREYSSEQSDETEKAFQVFIEGISETENSLLELKEIVAGFPQISLLIENLQFLTEDFKTSSPPAETNIAPDYANNLSPEEIISV